MKALGLAALLLSLVLIFLPIVGAYGTVGAALLAMLAGRAGFTMGLAAILINLVNLLLLSPVLYLGKNAGLAKGDYTPLLVMVGLVLVQVGCGLVLTWVARRKAPGNSNYYGAAQRG